MKTLSPTLLQDLLDRLEPGQDYRAARRRLAGQPDLLEAARRERLRLQGLCGEERKLWRLGFRVVAGADEVGRGPMAGPLVAGAVALVELPWIPGLNDSKQLTEDQREAVLPWVLRGVLAHAVAVIEVAEVNRGNLHELSLRAMARAVGKLGLRVDHLLVDGRFRLPLDLPQTALIKGDARSAAIAAASVVAKVHRDRFMAEQDHRYPGYGFASHKGYNTPEHKAALQRLGPCPLHRTSFAPVRELCCQQLTLDL